MRRMVNSPVTGLRQVPGEPRKATGRIVQFEWGEPAGVFRLGLYAERASHAVNQQEDEDGSIRSSDSYPLFNSYGATQQARFLR